MFYPLILAVLISLYGIYSIPEVKGRAGEMLTVIGLSFLDKKKFIIFNDIYIPAKDGMYTQIDHIVIGPGGVTVIETKNYSGKMKGNSRKKYWIVNRDGETSRVLNPIRQNSYHISMLRQNCPGLSEVKIFSVICLSPGSKTDIDTRIPITDAFRLAGLIKTLNNKQKTNIDIQYTAAAVKEIMIDRDLAEKRHKKILAMRYARRKNNRCPRCGTELLRRIGRRGEYLICKNYPKCTFRATNVV